MAAPASAAPNADSAISAAVTGRWGDIDGVWIDPVIAQEMITLGDDTVFPFQSAFRQCPARAEVTERLIEALRSSSRQRDQEDVNLWKSGVRFSLKAATPSFDSGVS